MLWDLELPAGTAVINAHVDCAISVNCSIEVAETGSPHLTSGCWRSQHVLNEYTDLTGFVSCGTASLPGAVSTHTCAEDRIRDTRSVSSFCFPTR